MGFVDHLLDQLWELFQNLKKLPELILKINATEKRKKDYVVKELPESEITSVSSIFQNKETGSSNKDEPV